MDKTMRIVEVGAPEDGKRTSEIVDEEGVDVRVEQTIVPGAGACWFNDKEFDHDEMVYSGNQILRCDQGKWVRSGNKGG